MSEIALQMLWYFVIGISIIFYAVLDGFDLGVGMLQLFTKKDRERRIFLNAIGPVWDGNEVWLVIVGGALFAGFPPVYATLVSGFYSLVMLLLCGLIFRAVAIEFRSKKKSYRWRQFWDVTFCLASYLIAFGLGVALGNLVGGVPVDAQGNFSMEFTAIFGPYPILVGILSVALFMMHGAIYLTMKASGDLHLKMRRWVTKTMIFFAVSYVAVTDMTLIYMPHMTEPFKKNPLLFFIVILGFSALLCVPYFFKKGRDFLAFGCSCFGIALLVALFGIGSYPYLVRSSVDPINSLTVFNSSSSKLTLQILFFIVLLGIPLVLAYGTMVYRIFRGKVTLGPTSY
jgi:cytochrome bd ubiquinol oxidase subunit II